MALGTFSGGGLGMGVAFFLEDFFSSTADEIEKKMDTLGGNTEKLAQRVDTAMNQMKLGASLTAIGGLILAPFLKGAESASDYTENINKLDVAFGAYAERVRAYTDNEALSKAGIGKNEAAETASLFGDMATGIGIGQEAAADMSIQLTQLAGDLKSFKNLKGDRAQNVLKGIFTGETESLKGIGVVMTQASLQAFATTQGINTAFKDLTEPEKVMLRMKFVMNATRNSMGDFVNTGETYANQQRKMYGSIDNLMITLGQIVEPIMAKLFGSINAVVQALDRVGQSPAGRFVLKLVAGLGALLVVTGLTLTIMGGLRFALFKTAWAFGGATKAALITTFANGGLSASFAALGVAIWTALAPVIPIILIVAAVIGLVYLAVVYLKQGFKDLADWDGEKSLGGIRTLFMGIAGVITAVSEIWQSFNGDTFTITASLADKLKTLGLLGFVIELGTWIARLKTIFNGVVDGYSRGFAILGGYFTQLKEDLIRPMQEIGKSFGRIWAVLGFALEPILELFHKLTGGIFKTKGELSGWATVANIISTIIATNFEIIGWVLTTVIKTIAWVVWAFVELIAVVIEFGAVIINLIATALNWLVDSFMDIIEAVVGFYVSMFEAGVGIMQALWDGFKSIFPSIAAWIEDKLFGLIGGVKKAIGWIGDKLGAGVDWVFGGGDDGDGQDVTDSLGVPKDGGNIDDGGEPTDGSNPLGGGEVVPFIGKESQAKNAQHTNSSKNSTVINNNSTTNTQEGSAQPIILQNIMDGEVISEKIMSKQSLESDRN